jgi:hypothetical protein
MKKNNTGFIIGSIAVISLVGIGVTLAFVKKKVKSAPTGSFIDKYAQKNPKAKLSTGEIKVPLYVWLLSKKS